MIPDLLKVGTRSGTTTSGIVYSNFLPSRNQFKLEEDFGVQKVMMGFDASWWMHCFSWVLLALLFLEIF